ncbi:MAG TPA: hypothetical protein VGJ03_17710 [Acidimicrobiales bacterium]|jgi:hypothetical protein
MGIDDPQDVAEALDDDELAGALEFPPERPFVVDDYGTTPAEERVPEALPEFVRREQRDRIRPLDDDEWFEVDETERDFATELEAPLSAEEAAIHVNDDSRRLR